MSLAVLLSDSTLCRYWSRYLIRPVLGHINTPNQYGQTYTNNLLEWTSYLIFKKHYLSGGPSFHQTRPDQTRPQNMSDVCVSVPPL